VFACSGHARRRQAAIGLAIVLGIYQTFHTIDAGDGNLRG
jgi:hypothetical protein